MLLIKVLLTLGGLWPVVTRDVRGNPKLECLPFSRPGSQMGRWDHSMLLQTLSTSVPAMVSTVLFPGGGQSPAVGFLSIIVR